MNSSTERPTPELPDLWPSHQTAVGAPRPDAERWRVSVFALVFHPDGSLLLVRQRKAGRWNLPGGKLRRGEVAEAGLGRELREETGLILGPLPRLVAAVELPRRHRLFLYFQAQTDSLAPADYTDHPEISAAAAFSLDGLPACGGRALRLWVNRSGLEYSSGRRSCLTKTFPGEKGTGVRPRHIDCHSPAECLRNPDRTKNLIQ